MVLSRPLLLTALALAVGAGLAAGAAGDGRVQGVAVRAGPVRVDGDRLILGPGALVGLGPALRVDLRGAFPAATVDVLRGDPGGAHVVAHLGRTSGLFRDDGSPLGADPPFTWQARASDTVTVDCRGTLQVAVGGVPRMNAPLGRACVREDVWVRARGEVRLDQASLDGRALTWGGRRFDPLRAGVATLTLVAGVLVIPLGGWRRGASAAAFAAGLAAAAALFAPSVDPAPADALPADPALNPAVPRQLASQLAARLGNLDPGRPTVLVLGGAATADTRDGPGWTVLLAAKLPESEVVVLSDAHATSWHHRKALEAAGVRGARCVSVQGFNDVMPSMPGLTLVGVEQGRPPVSGAWVAPVTLVEAADNHRAYLKSCASLLVVPEVARGRDAELDAWGQAVAAVSGLTVVDATEALGADGLRDDVHLSRAGHAALAGFVAAQLGAASTTPAPVSAVQGGGG